jgi:hypothetical protein
MICESRSENRNSTHLSTPIAGGGATDIGTSPFFHGCGIDTGGQNRRQGSTLRHGR